MNAQSDAYFWDRAAGKYASGKIADQAGYERTLERTCALLRAGDGVLELGCGTGTTALRLASHVRTYVATDFSTAMIAIAEEKYAIDPVAGLRFLKAAVGELPPADRQFDVILGFNYLHLVRDLPGTLGQIHALLSPHGLFVSKTPCVGDMNPLIRLVLLPVMRAFGMAPYAGTFRASDLGQALHAAGFDIVASEIHATRGNDHRPHIVARKR